MSLYNMKNNTSLIISFICFRMLHTREVLKRLHSKMQNSSPTEPVPLMSGGTTSTSTTEKGDWIERNTIRHHDLGTSKDTFLFHS